MKPVRIGLIGSGAIGSYGHFPGYLEMPDAAKVQAVCDKNTNAAKALAAKVGAKVYSEYVDLLKDPEIDAVDICLPHFLHGKVALAALMEGKHVIVEKPFTMDLKEADEIIRISKEKGLKVMVAENMRFMKAYQVAKSLVDQGAIGEICYARAYTGGPGGNPNDTNDWRLKLSESGGGTIMDDGIHCFYLFRWFVGEVKSIFSITTQFQKNTVSQVEDNAAGTLRFANGALGIFAFSTTTDSPWTEQLELFGTRGSIYVNFLAAQPLRLISTVRRSLEKAKWWSRFGDISWEEPLIEHSTTEWVTRSMRTEVQHFVNCILEDQEPLVTGEDGKKAVELVLKAYESAKLGREVAL